VLLVQRVDENVINGVDEEPFQGRFNIFVAVKIRRGRRDGGVQWPRFAVQWLYLRIAEVLLGW
jgi:hypothetical protein